MSAFYDNPSEPPRESFPPRQPAQVVRWNERKTISLPESSLVYQLLSPDLRGSIEFLWVEIAPGETMAASRYQHRGEECLVVIKGSNYHIWVDDQEYVLNVGDSIRHQGMSVHRSANLGNETAIVVVAISPPSF